MVASSASAAATSIVAAAVGSGARAASDVLVPALLVAATPASFTLSNGDTNADAIPFASLRAGDATVVVGRVASSNPLIAGTVALLAMQPNSGTDVPKRADRAGDAAGDPVAGRAMAPTKRAASTGAASQRCDGRPRIKKRKTRKPKPRSSV